ncbi:MAG: dihydrodipicolinate synthase family protein [Halobacteriales archaeon]
MTELEGVCPIVATPFTEDGAVDEASLRRLIETLLGGGCHGVTLFGVAGEYYKLTDDEQREMIELAAEITAGADAPLVVSVAENSIEAALARARFAEAAGADALMILPPALLAPTTDDHYAHLAAIGEAVSIPLMVQYAPETTGVSIDLSVFERLSREVETIRYFKIESRPPGGDISRLLDAAGDRIDVLVGYAGQQTLEAFDRGAVGVVPGSSMYDLYLAIYEGYQEGDRERARDLHRELLPLLSHCRQTAPMLVHYEKRILHRRGIIDSPRCRSPAFDPDEHYDRVFEEHYERLEPYLE